MHDGQALAAGVIYQLTTHLGIRAFVITEEQKKAHAAAMEAKGK